MIQEKPPLPNSEKLKNFEKLKNSEKIEKIEISENGIGSKNSSDLIESDLNV